MYRYVEDEVRLETLRVREEKRVLVLGQGGEGYIASDEWCYNCGGSGHFGDVSSHFTTSHRIEAPYDSILINHVAFGCIALTIGNELKNWNGSYPFV